MSQRTLLTKPQPGGLVAASVLGGAVFGVFVLWAARELTYPWAILGGSGSLWGVAAFAIGYLAVRPSRGVASGAVMLVVGLLAFYLAAAVFTGSALADAWSPAAAFWYVAGVVIGGLAGLAGAWASDSARPRIAVIGWAFPVALLWSEGLLLSFARGVETVPGAAYLLGLFGLAVLTFAVACVGKRSVRMAPAVVAAAVLLTVVGYLAFRATGIRHLA